MADNATDLAIRSQHGMLRDLVPIYSLYQLLPNLVALGITLWLTHWLGHFPTGFMFILPLGWVYQYVSRPCTMTVSEEQAHWLEAVLDAQKFYARSEADGRWRTTGKEAWQRWRHHFIAFAPGSEGVTVIAPRDVMESLRASVEFAEEHGEVFFVDDGQPFEFAPPEPEQLAWHMHVPTALLGAICVVGWIWHIFLGGMASWGVSGLALSQRRFETIFLHMFAHGSLMHLVMNMSALLAIGGTLVARLGPAPLNWLRFLALYFFSGLAGAALFLALHPWGTVPMLGASGALYGLIGLLIRTPADGGALLSVKSTRIRRVGMDLIKQNAFLFAMLALMSWSAGGTGGLAWEAHLGGFLFGLLVGPKLLPRASTSEEPVAEPCTPAGQDAALALAEKG
jgi:membrane associated rhomboid family serine protease